MKQKEKERCTLPDKMMMMMMLVDHECGSRMHLAAYNQNQYPNPNPANDFKC